MSYSDSEIKGILAEAFPHINPNKLSSYVYDQRRQEIVTNANAQAGYLLIGYFDSFCESIGVKYFAIAQTLAAAVTYHDFIPGSTSIEVGMLRSDYLAFEQAYYDFLAACGVTASDSYVSESLVDADDTNAVSDNADISMHELTANNLDNPTGFVLSSLRSGHSFMQLGMPVVTLCSREYVSDNGSILYSKDHLPIMVNASIRISVMDAVPNDYDLSRVLFFKMKQLGKQFLATSGAPRKAIATAAFKLANSYNNRPHDFVTRLFPKRSKSAPLEDLFPVRKLAFGPVEISCPNVTTTWVYEDDQSQRAQVGILQSDAMRITKEIDRICRKHDIGYFICGGTMLGLVRHGGFIPWDDDMDVGMLRNDYERFLEIAPGELQDEFFLQTRKSDPNIPYLFSKLRLKNSEYITEYNEFRDFDKGICVDIFPFDKAPIENGLFPAHYDEIKKLTREHNKIANRQVPKEGLPEADATNPMEVVSQGVMKARHAYYWHKSLTETQSAYDEFVTQYNDNPDLHFVASYVPTFTIANLDDLLPYQDVEFAGETLKAPAKPEVFLQMQYGDFMTLPLPHQQRGHDLLRWSDGEHSSEDFE